MGRCFFSQSPLCALQLQLYIAEIRSWMRDNMLRLNDNKTEVMIIGTKQQLSKLDENITVHIGSLDISPTESVHNLGFIIDSNLTNISHINKLSSMI